MWHSVSIDSVSLVEALQCWEGSQQTTNRPGQLDIPTGISWTPSQFQSNDFRRIASENSLNTDDDGEDNSGRDASDGNRIRHMNNKDLTKAERRRLRSKCTYQSIILFSSLVSSYCFSLVTDPTCGYNMFETSGVVLNITINLPPSYLSYLKHALMFAFTTWFIGVIESDTSGLRFWFKYGFTATDLEFCFLQCNCVSKERRSLN